MWYFLSQMTALLHNCLVFDLSASVPLLRQIIHDTNSKENIKVICFGLFSCLKECFISPSTTVFSFSIDVVLAVFDSITHLTLLCLGLLAMPKWLLYHFFHA